MLIRLLLMLTFIGIPQALGLIAFAGLWGLYWVVGGWLRLNDRREMTV